MLHHVRDLNILISEIINTVRMGIERRDERNKITRNQYDRENLLFIRIKIVQG